MDRAPQGVVVPTYLAHHQGMTLVALANALLGDRMVERFHAEPRVQATELLLQERVPRHVATIEPRPLDEMRVAAPAASIPVRRYRSPHTTFPHTQFLSNGNYVTSVTNAGGGTSVWRGLPVTRWRRDATRDADGQFIYLRDVRSGAVWSATYQPTRREPDEYAVTFSADRASFRRRDDDISTQLDIAVSTEDDVEVRRITVRNHGTRIRELDVTSYAEIVLTSAVNDLAHPAFGKLFVETEYLPDSAALLCHRRPRDPQRRRRLGVPRAEPREAARRGPSNGRPIAPASSAAGEARATRRRSTDARCRARPASCSIPIVSLRQRIRLPPRCHRAALLRDRHGLRSRHRRGARAEVPRSERARAHVRAGMHARRRAAFATWASPPTRRCCSSGSPRACSAPTARCARAPRRSPQTSSASLGCGRTRSPAICRSCSSAWSATRTCRSCGRCCRRRSTGA